MKTVVITGASGFVGGQTAIAFNQAGYQVIGIDRNWPHDQLKPFFYKFLASDFASDEAFYIIEHDKPEAIVHCGGTSLVGPSVTDPQKYYENNFVATKKLLDFLVDNEIDCHFVFSSSAAVYGEPIMPPCQEEDPPLPLSPYGESKHMVEMMLNSYANAYGLQFTAFRYFNVCGADSESRHGQEKNATHIIARVLEAMKNNTTFTLNGNNYPTPDGTCIRDYIHVEDIAHAHLLAVEHKTKGIYNLGSSAGNSNQEVIQCAQKVTGCNLAITAGPSRAGDPAVLTCSSDKFSNATGWSPTMQLEDIVQSAWNWYNK